LEKFALLNLLNLLQGLAPKNDGQTDGGEAPSASQHTDREQNGPTDFNPQASSRPAPQQPSTYPNVMASVIERHEAIANRIKNKK